MNNLLRLFIVGGLIASAFLIIAMGLARHNADLAAPMHLILFVIGVAIYLLPSVLALYRDCKATLWIAALNVLLGWTIFGWFIAIGWAAGGKTRMASPAMVAPPRPAH